jgi:hypothetical protein
MARRKKSSGSSVGEYAFIIGVIIAVVLGIAGSYMGAAALAWLTSILVVLGLVVGYMNVVGKDTKEFLLVATVLIIAVFAGGASDALGGVVYIGAFLKGIFNAVLAFTIAATIIVGLKDVFLLAKSDK